MILPDTFQINLFFFTKINNDQTIFVKKKKIRQDTQHYQLQNNIKYDKPPDWKAEISFYSRPGQLS